MSTKAGTSPVKVEAGRAAERRGGDGSRKAEMLLKIEGKPSLVDKESLERALRGVRGVLDAEVEAEGRVRVHYVPGEVEFADLKAVGDAAGYSLARPAAPADVDPQAEAQEKEYRRLMRKFWFAAAVGVPVLFTMLMEVYPALGEAVMPWHRAIGVAAAIITFPVLAWSGGQFFTGAWNNFKNHNTNMDTLVALGTGAAWSYSTLVAVAPGLFPAGTRGMFFDVAVIVIALIVLGQALEMRAKSRSSAAIKKLLELQAKTARVIRDGKETDIPIEEVVVGDTVLVRPGEKVPVDGVIVEGESAIDESVVTGESVPVDKKAGDQVIGSSVNKTGAFTFRATKVGRDTALAQIVEMVQRAQSSKPPIGRLVDVVASYFVPSVMIPRSHIFTDWQVV